MRVNKSCFAVAVMLAVSLTSVGQEYSFGWKSIEMNGTRTGVTFANADNVKEAMGEVKGRKYFAPDGRVFKKGSTRTAAKVMIDAQAKMADVKQVIAYAPEAMIKHAPECALSDWFIDLLMDQCSEITGKKVDFGFANFGGIRVDVPKGNVLLDDILSMFPFRNKMCYLELRGKEIREVCEQMASTGWQVIGGVRCVGSKSGKLLSVEIGGEPLDDDKIYGVVTIDFLLNGGDGYHLAKNAVSQTVIDKYIIDIVLPCVKKLTAEGKPLAYQADGRVRIVE